MKSSTEAVPNKASTTKSKSQKYPTPKGTAVHVSLAAKTKLDLLHQKFHGVSRTKIVELALTWLTEQEDSEIKRILYGTMFDMK